MVKKQRNILLNRRDAFIRLLLALVIIVLVNVVAQFYYVRFDLTTEKRYSISPSSREMVKNLKDVVTIKVYLAGDLNAGLKRLQESTRNTLNELAAYGGKNIEYEFINPMDIKDPQEFDAMVKDLATRGISGRTVNTQSQTSNTKQMVFPGALVVYGGREIAVDLLEAQIDVTDPRESYRALNNATILLEYKLVNAISKLTQFRPPQIGFMEGNGELRNEEVGSIQQTLLDLKYNVKRFNIDSNYYITPLFDVMVVAKPRTAFTEQNKYKIDQYIMRGGKVLWLVEGTNAAMDSLYLGQGQQFVIANDLGLDDMLFKYGVRVNGDVVQDIDKFNPIMLTTGSMQRPVTKKFPWYYYPAMSSENNHIIVRNLNPVAGYFVSTIDTVKNPGVNKTILLHTSNYSKAQMTPTRVHFGILQAQPNEAYYNQHQLPTAVLLEGEFTSSFQNRMSPEFLAAVDTIDNLKFIEKSKRSRMIVVADGDVIKNQFDKDGNILPLGYDRAAATQYANGDFILNCIEYLVNDKGILDTRNKEIKLRMLNGMKVTREKLTWQIVNITLPLLMVLLFGLLFGFLRRRKYAK